MHISVLFNLKGIENLGNTFVVNLSMIRGALFIDLPDFNDRLIVRHRNHNLLYGPMINPLLTIISDL